LKGELVRVISPVVKKLNYKKNKINKTKISKNNVKLKSNNISRTKIALTATVVLTQLV